MELNGLDFNKIAVFCQIVDSGNYQRASETLHVTPSALSQTITSLENSLGFSLFDRRGRKLVPTKDGLRIHREFTKYRGGFVQSLREMKGRREDVSGTLRIGAYLEFTKSKLTGILKDFIRDFPDANIKIVFDAPSRLQRLLDHGQIDLCLSIFPSAKKKFIRSKILCQQELVLVSPSHMLTDQPALEQFLEIPIIDYYFNHQPIARWLNLHFQKRPKKIPVRIFAATAEMVLSLVREGAGAGVVPKYLVASPETQAGLRIVRPTSKRLNDYIWLLEGMSSEKSALHTAFRSRLYEHFETARAT